MIQVRIRTMLLAAALCGISAVAVAQNAPKPAALPAEDWSRLKFEAGGPVAKDIPCGSTETPDSSGDPAKRVTTTRRAIVLDDVRNAGAEKIIVAGRTVKMTAKSEGTQSTDFSSELARQFKWMTGSEEKKKDYERWVGSGEISVDITYENQEVPPYSALTRILWLIKTTVAEERWVGEGRKKRTGTRTRTSYCLSGGQASPPYEPGRWRIDPCTNKWIPVAASK